MTNPKPTASPIYQMILSLFILSSCQLNPLSPDSPLPPPSSDAPTPTTPTPPPPSTPEFARCKKADAEVQCLALKIVSYEDSTSTTVLDKIKAQALVHEINSVWSTCKIEFQLERYESINPVQVGLQYNPNWRSEASQVRSTFSDQQTLLIVATGKLTSSTIAVTQMPGYSPFGILVEDSFSSNPLTVGHELGHYMGLYHFRNTSNLMNPYIGAHTEKLTSSQCTIARSTNQKNWVQMMR